MTETEKLQAECAKLREALNYYRDAGTSDAEGEYIDLGQVARDAIASTTSGADLLAERERDRKRIAALRMALQKIKDSGGFAEDEVATDALKSDDAAAGEGGGA